MNNILENIIATIIAAALSTIVAFILQSFGFGTQNATLFALLTLILLFLVVRGVYPVCSRWITERLLEDALNVNPNNADQARTSFKKRIIGRVLRENSLVEQKQSNSIIEYPNQDACETHICDAFRNARKVKILTIRGERYFQGSRSLLYKLYSEKRTKNFTIDVLVLSPESGHITDELAKDMGQDSANVIKGNMQIMLEVLKRLASQNPNFKVRCYDETPNFKILLFDDVMFVSAFTEPKNDHNAKMVQITRQETPLFMGLERHFEDLWERSAAPQ